MDWVGGILKDHRPAWEVLHEAQLQKSWKRAELSFCRGIQRDRNPEAEGRGKLPAHLHSFRSGRRWAPPFQISHTMVGVTLALLVATSHNSTPQPQMICRQQWNGKDASQPAESKGLKSERRVGGSVWEGKGLISQLPKGMWKIHIA